VTTPAHHPLPRFEHGRPDRELLTRSSAIRVADVWALIGHRRNIEHAVRGAKLTWLVSLVVAAVVVAGVVDAVRRSISHSEAAETSGFAITAAKSDSSGAARRLPLCTTAQLRLAFTLTDGSAALVLARVAGKPCHHGQSDARFIIRDTSGHRVPVFGSSHALTVPADFSDGFAQLIQIPEASCDPTETFLVVGAVGRHTARRSFPGTQLPCNHA